MSDLDPEQAEAAIIRICRMARFFPTVAEIRAEALGIAGLDLDGEALEAWREVKSELSRCGVDRVPVWSTAATAAAIGALGWRQYCQSQSDAEASWRARFVASFRAHRQREIDQALLGDAPPRPTFSAARPSPALPSSEDS